MKFKQACLLWLLAVPAALSLAADPSEQASSKIKLSIWDWGIKLTHPSEPLNSAYLWFFEWTMFDAVRQGEHTKGSVAWDKSVNAAADHAEVKGDWVKFLADATEDGADLLLIVTNQTDYDWPETAAIVPCFNAGNSTSPIVSGAVTNPRFQDSERSATYFKSRDGLDRLAGQSAREIHFNHALADELDAWDKVRDDDGFVWREKWPTSERDAYAGLIVRESSDRTQTIAIAWEDYVSVQGHNPWNCMHLSVRVGPLKPGQTKTIRGKAYFINGSKEDLLRKYGKDFE